MATSNEPEFRYLPRSSVKHGFGYNIPLGRAAARCGTSPTWYDPDGWLGTGTQAESERLASLPLCKRCERLYAQDKAIAAEVRAKFADK